MGPQIFGSKKINVCKTLGLKNLVKIWSVTAEIFLMWTNVSRTNVAWTNVTVTVGICERWSQEPSFKVWSKSGHYQLRYSLYGQMLPGQMLPGQMSLWGLASVKNGPRNLPLKFGPNPATNSRDVNFFGRRVGGWSGEIGIKAISNSIDLN